MARYAPTALQTLNCHPHSLVFTGTVLQLPEPLSLILALPLATRTRTRLATSVSRKVM